MTKEALHSLQMFVWNSGNAFADMRLLVEGAIALYENDAESICSRTLELEDKHIAIAFDTIGTALYSLQERITNMQLEYVKASSDAPVPTSEPT